MKIVHKSEFQLVVLSTLLRIKVLLRLDHYHQIFLIVRLGPLQELNYSVQLLWFLHNLLRASFVYYITLLHHLLHNHHYYSLPRSPINFIQTNFNHFILINLDQYFRDVPPSLLVKPLLKLIRDSYYKVVL